MVHCGRTGLQREPQRAGLGLCVCVCARTRTRGNGNVVMWRRYLRMWVPQRFVIPRVGRATHAVELVAESLATCVCVGGGASLGRVIRRASDSAQQSRV